MQEILLQKLHEYLRENNPDLLLRLEEEGMVTVYLQEKITSFQLSTDKQSEPAYILEERYLNLLTQDLRPSRYNYIKAILEEEFELPFGKWSSIGLLKFEIINLLQQCQPVFDECGFSEANENDPFLRYLIIGTIAAYLEVSETVCLKS